MIQDFKIILLKDGIELHPDEITFFCFADKWIAKWLDRNVIIYSVSSDDENVKLKIVNRINNDTIR